MLIDCTLTGFSPGIMLIDHVIVDNSILGDICELIIVLIAIVKGRVPGKRNKARNIRYFW